MQLSRKSAATAAAIACLSALALAATSSGEVVRDGNLQGSFSGGISPLALPRTELAPVTVQMGGKISTLDRTVPQPPTGRGELPAAAGTPDPAASRPIPDHLVGTHPVPQHNAPATGE
jgi:hypothetical protein